MQKERTVLGAVILFGGICCVASMDVIAKILSADVPVWQVNMVRFAFHTLFLAPLAVIVWRQQPANARRLRWRVHFLRGCLLAATSVFLFIALRDNAVPDTVAIFFVEPLIVIFLARLFLREAFDRRLLFAAAGGTAGVLIVLRPGGDYEWTILFALASAACFAGYIVSARFSGRDTPASVTAWLSAVFALLLFAPGLPLWEAAPARLWWLMAALGMFSAVGYTLFALALRHISASLAGILHYSEIGVAAILSWFVFAYWPDLWVWTGIGVIVASNLYALGLAQKTPAATPPPA